MGKETEQYLTAVEKQLRAMPIGERTDVIHELKSYIEDLQRNENKTEQEVLAQLTPPKELAREYLRDCINKTKTFQFRKLAMMFSFYSLAGLSGMFVFPFTIVLSVGLMLCGVVSPLAGLVKFIGFLMGYDLPFVVIQLGFYRPDAVLSLPISIVLGILLFIAGRALWKLNMKYINVISKTKKKYIDG